jgi:hypothetical protein
LLVCKLYILGNGINGISIFASAKYNNTKARFFLAFPVSYLLLNRKTAKMLCDKLA